MIRIALTWARIISAAALVGMLPNDAEAQWSDPVENELIMTGGWLFDGTGGERVPNPGIVIRNGKFSLLARPMASSSTA